MSAPEPYIFIGVDPGPTPGVVALTEAYNRIDFVRIAQCSASALLDVVKAFDPNRIAQLQVELFVPRGRLTAAQRVTNDQVAVLEALYSSALPIVKRSASRVKPWATDERLEAAHLAEHLKGMRHARDAARHALFLAVNLGAIPDPLSRKART